MNHQWSGTKALIYSSWAEKISSAPPNLIACPALDKIIRPRRNQRQCCVSHRPSVSFFRYFQVLCFLRVFESLIFHRAHWSNKNLLNCLKKWRVFWGCVNKCWKNGLWETWVWFPLFFLGYIFFRLIIDLNKKVLRNPCSYVNRDRLTGLEVLISFLMQLEKGLLLWRKGHCNRAVRLWERSLVHLRHPRNRFLTLSLLCKAYRDAGLHR